MWESHAASSGNTHESIMAQSWLRRPCQSNLCTLVGVDHAPQTTRWQLDFANCQKHTLRRHNFLTWTGILNKINELMCNYFKVFYFTPFHIHLVSSISLEHTSQVYHFIHLTFLHLFQKKMFLAIYNISYKFIRKFYILHYCSAILDLKSCVHFTTNIVRQYLN